MKCRRLFVAINKTNSGFGLLLLNTEVLRVYVGERSRKVLKPFGSRYPVYRQCAVCYTDFWQTYEQVIPSNHARAVRQRNRTNKLAARGSTTQFRNESDD